MMTTMAHDPGLAMARRADAAEVGARLETAGGAILRYGLAGILLYYGAWATVPGWPLPMPGMMGSFLIKDLFLLGAAVWIAGESLRAASSPRG